MAVSGSGAAEARDVVAGSAEREAAGAVAMAAGTASPANIRPCTLETASRMAASITASEADFGRQPQMPRAASAVGACSGSWSDSTRMRCGASRSRASSSCVQPANSSAGMPKTSRSALR
ncbi:hypothetical protein D3C87_1781800 [compost metagenome]